MKAERVQTAILYAELRNFTRLSEVLPPNKVLRFNFVFFFGFIFRNRLF